MILYYLVPIFVAYYISQENFKQVESLITFHEVIMKVSTSEARLGLYLVDVTRPQPHRVCVLH